MIDADGKIRAAMFGLAIGHKRIKIQTEKKSAWTGKEILGILIKHIKECDDFLMELDNMTDIEKDNAWTGLLERYVNPDP